MSRRLAAVLAWLLLACLPAAGAAPASHPEVVEIRSAWFVNLAGVAIALFAAGVLW